MTLNARQHVRLAGGVRLPVTQTSERRTSVIVYLLWDWYKGRYHPGVVSPSSELRMHERRQSLSRLQCRLLR